MLAHFRPPLSTPESLQRLLERRADPNINLVAGRGCPLDNIMTFALQSHVEQMRYLLLDYGATNTPALERQWIRRRQVDVSEKRRLAMIYDPRPLL